MKSCTMTEALRKNKGEFWEIIKRYYLDVFPEDLEEAAEVLADK